MTRKITTEHDTTVELVEQDEQTEVRMTNAKGDSTIAGRVVRWGGEAGFQPVPFADFAFRADVLEAIADLVRRTDGGDR